MSASEPHDPSGDDSHALALYRRRASYYDLELAAFEPLRREAIARLELKRGDVVLDVGCGTGLSLPLLQKEIGARGHIIGIELSPEMIALARERELRHGWRNVTLILAPAGAARLEAKHADAALFHFTHDILRDPSALAHVARGLRPGARVVACGLQWAKPWAWPMNLFVLGAALHSVSSLAGLERPWSHLAGLLEQWQVSESMGGAVFIASGRLKQSPDWHDNQLPTGDPP